MLEGDAERLLEVPQDVQGRIGVLDVVVGEFLSLDLAGESEREGNRIEAGVELGALMRVFAVAESLLEIVFEEEFFVQSRLLAHILRDAAVVLGRMGISLGGKLKARFRRRIPLLADFSEDGIVIGRIADDGDVPPVLGGAADHGRAADIDILDGVLEGDSFLRDGLAERIEVHADQVDRLDAVFFQGFHMGGHVPAGQDTAVNLRMEGLDPSVADFREAGHFTDSNRPDALAFQKLLRSAGRDDFPTKIDKPLDESDETCLVTDTY